MNTLVHLIFHFNITYKIYIFFLSLKLGIEHLVLQLLFQLIILFLKLGLRHIVVAFEPYKIRLFFIGWNQIFNTLNRQLLQIILDCLIVIDQICILKNFYVVQSFIILQDLELWCFFYLTILFQISSHHLFHLQTVNILHQLLLL